MTTTIKKEDVKAAAAGQWQRVFETLGFPDIEIGVHGPCPKCGGTDRFRLFDDFNETGGMICGAGGCNVAHQDGLSAAQWWLGCKFREALERVAEAVGMEVKKQRKATDDLVLIDGRNETLVPYFEHHNAGVKLTGMDRAGFVDASYKGEAAYAIPCYGRDDRPRHYVVMSALTHTMWHWNKHTRSHEKIRKKTLGKGAGIIGAAKEIADSAEVWKTEGPTDCAALLSFVPAVAWTNVHGAGEKPTRWICEKFAGKVVNIAHDADTAGKSGAERWAAALNQFADVRIVELPDGYDVRRFLTEAQQRHLLDGKPPGEAASLAFDELTALAGKAELMPRGTLEQKEQLGDGEDAGQELPAEAVVPLSAVSRLSEREIRILAKVKLQVVGMGEDVDKVLLRGIVTNTLAWIPIDKISTSRLLLIGGAPCREILEKGDEDPDSITIGDVRRAIALAAGERKISPERIHGPGIYSVDGVVVLNNGTHLAIFNGSELDWTVDPAVGQDVFRLGDSQAWFSHFELNELVKRATTDHEWAREKIDELTGVVDRWTWGTDADARLVAGLLMATVVQQSFAWRPQVSIRGQSNAGKTVLMKFLFEKFFAGISLSCSISSAAGIRQEIRNDSRVIGLDEFDQLKRPAEILGLIRTASRSDAVILGSASHRAVRFALANICWIAGIHVSLDDEADVNRFICFDLLKAAEPKKSAFRQPGDQELESLRLPIYAIAIARAKEAAEASATLYAQSEARRTLNDRVVENYCCPVAMLGVATGQDGPTMAAELDRMLDRERKAGNGEIVSSHETLFSDILGLTIDLGSSVKKLLRDIIRDGSDHEWAQARSQLGVFRMTKHNQTLLAIDSSVVARVLNRQTSPTTAYKGNSVTTELLRLPGAASERVTEQGARFRVVAFAIGSGQMDESDF